MNALKVALGTTAIVLWVIFALVGDDIPRSVEFVIMAMAGAFFGSALLKRNNGNRG